MGYKKGDEWINLGKTSFRVETLKELKLSEAIEHYSRLNVHENRIRNAWKQANGKK